MPIRLRFALATTAMLAVMSAHAQITMTSSVADGATIRGVQDFRFTVQSKSLITEVEFYVNDDLRDTDDSTPYEFKLDTIAETEGPIKVKVLAYDNDGNRKEILLNLRVDNELGKGADYHVGLGREEIADGKWENAINRGRVALKATPKYIPARLLLARANFGKGVYDSAQKFVEDVLVEEPNNVEALDLKSVIALQVAFGASGTRESTVATMSNALKLAAESRNKIYAQQLEAFGKPTDENRMRYVDLAIRAGRFSLVFPEMEPLFRANPRNSAAANRLIYAQLRAGRFKSATDNAAIYARRGLPDATGWALVAITRFRAGDVDGALEAEGEAVKNDSSDLSVRSAQAFLALSRARGQAFGQFVTDLAKEEDQRFEVMHYRSILANIQGEFEGAKTFFQSAVLSEPTSYETFIMRGNQLISYSLNPNAGPDDVKYDRALAKSFFEGALAAKPESFEALTGLAILEMLDNKLADALRLAQAAAAAGPEYAAGHFFLATVQSLESTRLRTAAVTAEGQAATIRSNGQIEEANKMQTTARNIAREADRFQIASEASLRLSGQLDRPNLEGKGLPTALEAWRYFSTAGRPVFIIQPQN